MPSRSNPIDVHVGNRLRLLRLQKGLTQEDLGTLVGVSYQQIQKYETGSNRISASRLYLISCQLGVGPEYFFEDLDPAAALRAAQHLANEGEDRHLRA
ncbi:hypothetical protein GCM10011390_03510 [Aureimonas endophytica]|uniref:HTH cro/C1-type domain-containing protein n=1 Tax=Aureimonas endophytica TaxID=2027858 RepID=A0A916ZCK0_9HYPH|nr:helix-turn-helix transcriptional regulator [Aureimonas endophytica]GGD88029.1 hypothetical protein GCM10011390_03510 [Aureimonas endophytica]